MAPAASTLVNDPPPSIRTTNSNSPITIKISSAANSCPAPLGIEQKRENTLIELGQSVPQLPTDFFTGDDGILPPLPSDKAGFVDGVLKDLKKRKVLKSSHWTCYKEAPSQYSAIENVVFADIDTIALEIQKSACLQKEPTLEIKCNPDRTPIVTARNNKTRPDCYGVLRNSGNRKLPTKDTNGKPYWMYIGVPGEFKKSSSDAIKNWTQILWSMNYVFQEDPRRRFVFGFTIEDTNMRIWFASRSDVLVSLPFDFNASYHHMVKFFLRVMYASEDQLGWDTTMERLPRKGPSEPFQYKIDCNGVMYKTVRILSAVGAEAIRGRGTRVWEVREIIGDSEDEKPLVLKDAWVDHTRKREANILQEVRAAAEAKGLLEGFERHFMRVKRFGDVYIGEKRALDHTHQLILRKKPLDPESNPPLRFKAEPPSEPSEPSEPNEPIEPSGPSETKGPRKALQKETKAAENAPQDDPAGTEKGPADPVEKILRYAPKVHHRIVFEELGCTITQVNTFSGALSAMSDAMRGLQLLHQCGWVHRDISTGNILVVNGVGKLSDLEYAKHETDAQSHGIRTGTPYFMATEVDDQQYIHVPTALLITEPLGNFADIDDLELSGDEDEGTDDRAPVTGNSPAPVDGSPDKANPQPPYDPNDFKHNPLHDVESALWVIVWILVCSKFFQGEKKIMSDKKWAGFLKTHGRVAWNLFKNARYRDAAINPGVKFGLGFAGLLPRIRHLANELVPIRGDLLEHYLAACTNRHTLRKDPPFATVAGTLLERMIDLLDRYADMYRTQNKDLNILVGLKSENRLETKHMAEETAADTSKVDPLQLPTLSELSTRRSSEDAEAEPVSRKRQKVSHGEAVSTSAIGTSQTTPSRGQKARL